MNGRITEEVEELTLPETGETARPLTLSVGTFREQNEGEEELKTWSKRGS